MRTPRGVLHYMTDDLGYERDFTYRAGGPSKPMFLDWIESVVLTAKLERWLEVWPLD